VGGHANTPGLPEQCLHATAQAIHTISSPSLLMVGSLVYGEPVFVGGPVFFFHVPPDGFHLRPLEVPARRFCPRAFTEDE